jgi:hypothetical protein
MAGKRIKFGLDGEVSLSDFRRAIDAFAELLEQLTDQANPEATVKWVIRDLRGGSAAVEVESETQDEESEVAANEVTQSMDEIGRISHLNRYELWTVYPRVIRQQVREMFAAVAGNIPRAKLNGWVIEKPVEVDPPSTVIPRPKQEHASLRGKIVTLDDKKGTYFTLREAFTDRSIRCWPDPRFRSALAEHWKNNSWVLVEGTYNTLTNKPTMIDITEILPLGTGERGAWKKLFGISQRTPEDSQDSASELVRKVRDG